MPRLAERQHQFGAALLDAGLPPPSGVVGPDGEPCPLRFAVYRNNVVVGLIRVLEDNFPAIARLVGVEFFRAMAGAYVRVEPPRAPMLFDYGEGFADFIAAFEPAAGLPYLADVARIERAWLQAYHAPDAQPLDPQALVAIEADRLPRLCLRLHPSLRIVRSRLPALTIWRMNVGPEEEPRELVVNPDADGEDALVARPEVEVEVRSIPPGGADFLQALGDGRPVCDAAVIAQAADARFDLAANVAGLIEAGAFVGYDFADEDLIHA